MAVTAVCRTVELICDLNTEITESTEMKNEEITNAIIASAIEVHRELGPGLLETTYEICLAHELARSGHDAVRQLHLPVVYKGVELDAGYRIDLLVDRLVVVEVKATSRIEAIHQAQLLSYLRLSGHQVGLLLNFNVRQMREGIKRLVMDQPAA